MLFRACKSNVMVTFTPIDPNLAEEHNMPLENKENFLILLPGESSTTLKRKVTRILDSLGIPYHPVPSQNHGIHEQCRTLTHSLQENAQLVTMTRQEIVSLSEEFV